MGLDITTRIDENHAVSTTLLFRNPTFTADISKKILAHKINTRPLLLLVISLTSLLAESRLYKGELCLLRVQYHSLLGHSQGLSCGDKNKGELCLLRIQRHSLLRHSQGCLTTEEVRLC